MADRSDAGAITQYRDAVLRRAGGQCGHPGSGRGAPIAIAVHHRFN